MTDFFRKFPILITGATGHTGRHLVRRLIGDGYAIRVFTRSRGKALDILGDEIERQIAEGNLEEPETLARALSGCGAIISLSHVRFAPALIAACEKTAVRRAIFISSARRYTRFPDAPAEQVRQGEAAIRRSALDFTILRPTMIFGDERDNNLTQLIQWMRKLPFFPLPGGGWNLVQPTFVHDLVNAIVRAYETEGAIGREYDIGGPEPMTYRAMIRLIAAAMGMPMPILPLPLWPFLPLAGIYERLSRRPRLTRAMLQRLAEDKAVDIAAARRDLGFSPTPFSEAIARKIRGEV
ncbi:MAG: NAD(P)H-binding protein [Candidatus Sumerlaeota bacterium]|nr:NAD(P)H-binding protein [Candidatus Sumerlaeota bacterium]